MSMVKGSGGYIVADLTDEEKKVRLGGEYFIGAIGRIDEARIRSYHCNNCNKDFEGSPIIRFERVNKEVEGVMLAEEGEYVCKECNSVIAQYKKFGESKEDIKIEDESKEEVNIKVESNEGLLSISRFVGMDVFDDKARSLGKVKDLAIDVSNNSIILKVSKDDSIIEVGWDKIIAISDIVLVKSKSNACSNCGYVNKEGARFCEQCGSRL